jgi:hypothetical protein
MCRQPALFGDDWCPECDLNPYWNPEAWVECIMVRPWLNSIPLTAFLRQ